MAFATVSGGQGVELASDRGSIQRIVNFKSDHLPTRNVDIWLPEGYNSTNSYTVLYMHDGGQLFDSTTTWNGQEWGVDETMQLLIDDGAIRPTIVVAIWNGNEARHSEYFPQKPFESLDEQYQDYLLTKAMRSPGNKLFSSDIQSDAYLKFIVEDLKPYIDQTFSTKSGRADTFLAGSSMGGLISLYGICEYPEIFGGAACLSTHWPGIFVMFNNPIPDAFMSYLDANTPDPALHKLYFDYGTESLDAMYESTQIRADAILKEHGYTDKSLMSLKFDGDGHNELAWQKRLHIPLTFLLTEE